MTFFESAGGRERCEERVEETEDGGEDEGGNEKSGLAGAA